MILHNETKIDDQLIRLIMIDAGLDLRDDFTLFIEYKEDIKGVINDGNLGTCQSSIVNGRMISLIRVAPWASTKTLAHEIRHVYQAWTIGADILNEIYGMESSYEDNIFEVDAREFEGKY